MKNTIFLVLQLPVLCNLLVASEHHKKTINSIMIKNASYLVYNRQNEVSGAVAMTSQRVTFYSYDGTELKTMPHNHYFGTMSATLDPRAPKPQPFFFDIKEIAATKNLFGTVVPGGKFIIFYDKHNNRISSHRYHNEHLTHAYWSTFKHIDLSNIIHTQES